MDIHRTTLMSAASLLIAVLSGCASTPHLASDGSRPELRLGLRITGDAVALNAYEFVLYDTGLVIIKRRRSDDLYEFFSVELSRQEVTQLLDELQLKNFFALDESYDLYETASDLPTYTIEAWDPARSELRRVRVRGILSEHGHRFDSDMTFAAPSAFVRVYERLDSYSHPRERPWFPEQFDIPVSSWPGRGKSCPWPRGWEDLDSAGSTHLPARPDSPFAELGIIRIRGSRLLDVQRFLDDCHRTTGEIRVLVNQQPVWLYPVVNLPHQQSDGS